MPRSLIALTCLIASAIALPALAAAPAYRIDAVCQLPQHSGDLTDINNRGQIIGVLGRYSPDCSSFLWQNGTTQTLQSLGGRTIATAINEKNQITGYCTTTDSYYETAVIWQNGVVAPIGNLGGQISAGYDINESGTIAAYSDIHQMEPTYGHTYTWSSAGTNDMGKPGSPTGINDAGNVAGRYDDKSFIWRDGIVTDIGSLTGFGGKTYATRINNTDQIVGWSYDSLRYRHAFLWQNYRMVDLDQGSYRDSLAMDINDRGLIVGQYGWGDMRACMWQNSELIDLNTLLSPDSGWTLTDATAVNDLGQIVGQGYYNGEYWGYVMTPVPEPSSFAALACGFAGISGLVFKRKRL